MGVSNTKSVVDEIMRLGMKCNFRCPFCNVFENEKCSELNLEEAKKLADSLVGKSDVVSISGGEPTVYPYLVELIEYMSAEHPGLNLQTNAVLVTKEKADEFAAAGLATAFVNLPSHIPSVYAELTDTGPEFLDKAIEGIRAMIDAGIPVTVNLVINEVNRESLSEYLKFIHKELPRVKVVNFSVIQPHGMAKKNSHLVPDYRDLKEQLKNAIDLSEKLGIKLVNPFCGLPTCITYGILPLEASSEYIAAEKTRRSKLDELEQVQTNSKPKQIEIISMSKTKVPNCIDCYLKNFCMGPWTAYPKIRGEVVEPPFRALRFWPQG